jgi:hypothetical protein
MLSVNPANQYKGPSL